MKIRSILAATLVLLPLSTHAGWGQLVPSPDAPPVSHAPAAPVDDNPVATFHVDVNLVTVIFTAKGKDGNLLPHLTKSDCEIREDKVPQTLKSFVAETHQPLTLGILLDTSGSQQNVLPLEQDAGSRFLQRVLKPKDEAFLVSFDVDVDLLQDYTNSARQLSRALNKAEINTAAGNGAGGIPGAGGGTIPVHGTPKGTLLYDAVYLAANQKMAQESGRKAIILLTDGDDQGSRNKIQDAIAAAQRSNVIVYTILIADTNFYGGMGYSGFSTMKKLTEETGGRLINVGNNGKKLEEAFAQIEDELRTQYVATYTPSNMTRDGKFRRLEVGCLAGEGVKVQVRKGYFAPGPSDN